MTLVRWLAVVAAICLVGATLLFLGLSRNVFVAEPRFPNDADLPTRLLGSIDARQASWPFDFASSLLFAVAFGAFAVLGRLLALAGRVGDARSSVIGSTLWQYDAPRAAAWVTVPPPSMFGTNDATFFTPAPGAEP